MQVFLPYPDYKMSVDCLDKKRRNKQVVEASQIIDCLTGVGSLRWKNHPAVRMYRDNVNSLIDYYNLCLESCLTKLNTKFVKMKFRERIPNLHSEYPFWFGMEIFHQRHRERLLEKNIQYYSQFGWKESPGHEYYWPV